MQSQAPQAQASVQPKAPGQAQRVAPAQQKDPRVVAIATAVRYNQLLKQRQGIVVSTKNRSDFFRYKRFERAIQSAEVAKKVPELSVTTKEEIQQVFVQLIQNQLVLPVNKLSTANAKARGVSIDKQTPALELTNKATLQADEYYVWNFSPPNPYLIWYTLGALVVVFGLILFPLWPLWMRKGVWYISNGALGLLGAFFGLALVRLVIYLATVVVCKDQLWVFPNLFADCGVLESFQPYYEWTGEAKLNKKKKSRTSKAKTGKQPPAVDAAAVPTNTTATGSATASGNPVKKRTATVEDVTEES